MACLVQATYLLEIDRKKSQKPRAPAWWASFGFELVNTFIDDQCFENQTRLASSTANQSMVCQQLNPDEPRPNRKKGEKTRNRFGSRSDFQNTVVDKDALIFGAIYKNTRYNNRTPQAPRFVIAFRGTILEADNVQDDLSHNLLVGDGGLGSTSLLEKATQHIVHHISEFGAEGTYLAGHSLGSTMAILVGANLATKGIHLKTFLFNLPSSLPEEEPFRRLIARLLQITPLVVGLAGAVGMFPLAAIASLTTALSLVTLSTLVTATGIATLTSLAALAGASALSMKKRSRYGDTSLFAPHIFVNPEDPVCRNWIPYFCNEPRENKRSQLPFASFVESGVLMINSTPGQGMPEAHSLKQWWQPGIKLLSLNEYGSHQSI